MTESSSRTSCHAGLQMGSPGGRTRGVPRRMFRLRGKRRRPSRGSFNSAVAARTKGAGSVLLNWMKVNSKHQPPACPASVTITNVSGFRPHKDSHFQHRSSTSSPASAPSIVPFQHRLRESGLAEPRASCNTEARVCRRWLYKYSVTVAENQVSHVYSLMRLVWACVPDLAQ